MNVLLIGSGGREHALALKLSQSRKLKKLFVIPGNPGIGEIAECFSVDIMGNKEIVDFAKQHSIDLVVVGPEDPLANGIADALQENNIKVFGPNKLAAQFEASKVFARDFMKKHDLPSVKFESFTEFHDAKKYIESKGAPIVVKVEGLAAGKGVCVAQTKDQALEFAEDCLIRGRFGGSGSKVIVEECLFGEEASYLTFVDGKDFVPMVYSQDHKHACEGDTGPNTGGMGCYSPAPILESFEGELEEKIMKPFLQGIKEEGIEYKGVLYVGLMKTKEGLKILEFNVRFGDPETQVILPRMKSDLIEVMLAVADGTLSRKRIEWSGEHAMCVVLASKGYPGSYEKGKVITGLDDVNGVQVIHAGTKEDSGSILTNGGRVLNVVALAESLPEAASKAYDEIRKINWNGVWYRKDIGFKELERLKRKCL
ncbi:phosphoribosylamine--glycine ligase [Candidatus Woesearchaeota archaeon]|nr:phosphoribosylamine--glycine ligase [Candidatus Woesearchaeota archaeon]